jgi:maltose alpha-D-glucosyltransferase/alpha-amylase
MNALLLSLTGTPILYYGDEIGMGDNYYIGDRNGVRTPMHWSGDRNAGFSRANPQSLYLPVIIDPEYHYEVRNVEVQHANPHSLLWWTRRVLDLRKQYPAFGHGSFEALPSNNAKVFSFLRETADESLLVVANLSRFSQHVELDLSRFRGRMPMELFGRTSFPVIDDRPYRISLGPHGFIWFCIGCHESDTGERSPAELPTIRLAVGWDALLKGRGRKNLREALEPYLREHRWFAGKARTLTGVDIIDVFDMEHSASGEGLRLLLVSAAYAEGEPDSYVLPLMLVDADEAEVLLLEHRNAGVLRIESAEQNRSLVLCEATWNHDFWRELLATLAGKHKIQGQNGMLSAVRTGAFAEMWEDGILILRSAAVSPSKQTCRTSPRWLAPWSIVMRPTAR